MPWSPRLREYAKLNAAVGINGAVINNVNASSKILGEDYLRKVATIADELRPYAMKVYLSVNFAAPMQLGIVCPRPIRSIRRCRNGGKGRPTRFISSSPISEDFW